NEIIPEVIRTYSVEIQRLRRTTINLIDRKEQTQKEMRRIFEALKTRNIEAAVQSMTDHILNIKAAIGILANE
ncbi:MAG: FCD domain-containing protein, partial [Spirochaetales bacterium]|nr:FCD domain-containing protein [Spirochaetales bacterium]